MRPPLGLQNGRPFVARRLVLAAAMPTLHLESQMQRGDFTRKIVKLPVNQVLVTLRPGIIDMLGLWLKSKLDTEMVSLCTRARKWHAGRRCRERERESRRQAGLPACNVQARVLATAPRGARGGVTANRCNEKQPRCTDQRARRSLLFELPHLQQESGILALFDIKIANSVLKIEVLLRQSICKCFVSWHIE